MATIFDLKTNNFTSIIRYLEIQDIQQLIVTCKWIHARINKCPEWMDCIRRSGQFHKIYDGTNLFCVKEFLKKDSSFIRCKKFKLNKEVPLNTLFVDHFFNLNPSYYKLFRTHQDTFDYVMRMYPHLINIVLDHVDEARFNYVIQTYKPPLNSVFNGIIKYGTPEILQRALNEINKSMKWFVKIQFDDVFAFGNAKLLDVCIPFIQPSKKLVNTTKIINVNHNHLPFISYLITHDMLRKRHVISITKQTTDPEICRPIYNYYIRRKDWYHIQYVITRTGNEYFFNNFLSLELNVRRGSEFMNSFNVDHVKLWLQYRINFNQGWMSFGSIFSLHNHGTSQTKDIKIQDHHILFTAKDWFRYRLSWLEKQPIHKNKRFGHIWRYIHDTYGEVVFLDVLKNRWKDLTMPVISKIRKWYPKIIDLI